MADITEGSFTHTLEQIDAATTQVEDAKGNAASLAAAITAAAETAASTAVGTLDVSSVGGTGKYISEIKQEDGKISATPTSLASAPASGGTAAISSGAVYTAISDKITMENAYGRGTNVIDVAGYSNDLNNITGVGRYWIGQTTSKSAANMPFSVGTSGIGCELIVEKIQTDSRIRQTIIKNPGTISVEEIGKFWVRLLYSGSPENSPTWSNWFLFAGTEIIPSASLTSINPAQLQVTPPDDGGEESEER